MMPSKTTVAVDDYDRKKIRKISVLLEISQGEVIHRAIKEFEDKIISERQGREKNSNEQDKIEKILREATEKAYASDPEFKDMQEELFAGPETIDDFIIDEWDSGLDD